MKKLTVITHSEKAGLPDAAALQAFAQAAGMEAMEAAARHGLVVTGGDKSGRLVTVNAADQLAIIRGQKARTEAA